MSKMGGACPAAAMMNSEYLWILRIDHLVNVGDIVDKSFGFNEEEQVVSTCGAAQSDIQLSTANYIPSEVEIYY